jgi:hypothetical protein
MPVDPMPVDPMPVDPMPVDPMPVDPMPVGPMPVDPMPVGPMPACAVVVLASSWLTLASLAGGMFPASSSGASVSSSPRQGWTLCPFPLPLCVAVPPQALSRPGRGCRTMAQCWWLFAFLFVAVACRLPDPLLHLRPLLLRYSFGCAVLAAIAPLPFAMALLFGYGAAAVGDCAASAGDPSFRCWRPRCCRW